MQIAIAVIISMLFLSGCASKKASVSAEMQKPLYISDCSRYADVKDEVQQKIEEITGLLQNTRTIDKKVRIAVMDFGDFNGNTSDFGRNIAEELINNFGSKKVNLVDRRQLGKALAELKLNSTDLFNPKFSVRFGELTGATSLVTGTLVDMEGTVRINARLIETETARIISTAGIDIKKTVSICKMIKQNITVDQKSYELLSLPSSKSVQDEKTSPSVFKDIHLEKSPKITSPPAVAIQKVRGKNLVANGNFKNRYDKWKRTIGDEGKGSSKSEIARYANANSGVALHIKHVGEGFIQYSQVIPVADADLIFSATFEAKSSEGGMVAFSGTGVTQIALQYMDENENVIGQTILVNYVKNMFADTPLIGAPRLAADTNTTRYLGFRSGVPYRGYKINIRRELEDNLIGVNAGDIRMISIGIWSSATHRGASTELWISDITLIYK